MSVLSFARLLISSAIISLPLAVSAAEAASGTDIPLSSSPTLLPEDNAASLTDTVPVVRTDDHSAPALVQNETRPNEGSRPIRIAYLMPSDESPVLAAAKIVGNGLIAACRTSDTPSDIMLIESSASANVLNQIEEALFAGADVVVGPLEKNRVDELAAAKELPLPVVALNIATDRVQDAPSGLIMLSVSTDIEAEYIASLAVKALPEATESGSLPKVIILKTDQAWEDRISTAYEKVLTASGTQYEVFNVTMDNLQDLQDKLRPTLSESDLQMFLQMKTDAGDDEKALKTVEAAMRAKAAVSEPPCQAALLALDARTAGLVRNRLPLRTRVWATSTTNPGDTKGSSSASALAYDLNNVAFTECPLILKYDTAGFEARFGTSMPFSLPAKRLFALGADVLNVAEEWARGHTVFSLEGETGRLVLNRDSSALIERIPAMAVILNGDIINTETALLEKKGDMPKITVADNKPIELTPVGETLTPLSKSTVVSVTAEEVDEVVLPPSPMLPKPASLPKPFQPSLQSAVPVGQPVQSP